MMMRAWILPLCALLCSCASPSQNPQPEVDVVGERAAVEATLDALHREAAQANEDAYFALFAPDGVFLGTDATERWTVEEFRAYAHPHFAKGKGWTYTVKTRHVSLSDDGAFAWFDETLDNKGLGDCRGSGALRNTAGAWKIVQYNLTIPIPNALAKEFAERIREQPGE